MKQPRLIWPMVKSTKIRLLKYWEVSEMADTKIIVIPDGKICDYIDQKFRNDTPEEYVRQTIEKRLVNEHRYLPE